MKPDEGLEDVRKIDDISSNVVDKFSEVFRRVVGILNSTCSSVEADRASAKLAIELLSGFVRNEKLVNAVVECGAVPALVRLLIVPDPVPPKDGDTLKPYEYKVEKGSAYTLGLLAAKPEHQQLIVDAGALPHLVDLLKRHRNNQSTRAVKGVIRRAAEAIHNLAYENSRIQSLVRVEGGIPPLVELIEFIDTKVQIAAVAALRSLAFKNDENKNQIVECKALPTLIFMLRSEDAKIHYEAVNFIEELAISSRNISEEVVLNGGLQPVIGLLSSPSLGSRKNAALLLVHFAQTFSDSKAIIVQRGAVPPLIDMLQSPDDELRNTSAFVLSLLAKDKHNQAGIAHSGAVVPLLRQLENGYVQHNAVRALFGLACNEDNVSELIRAGGVQNLQDAEFTVDLTRDVAAEILKGLEAKIHGRVLRHLLYLMCVGTKEVQIRVALALAHLCSPDDQRTIFIDNIGLDLLLELLGSSNLKYQRLASVALCKLSAKASTLSPVDAAPPSPTPQVYLGEHYVNNPTLSDVTFLIEGKPFYAQRICLTASSDFFRGMLDGGYSERDAKYIEIPNIRWNIFELVMRYMHTGSVIVNSDVALDLLMAADHYLLKGLKQLCVDALAQDISVDNVSEMFDLSKESNAVSLGHASILFILQNHDKLSVMPGYSNLISGILPDTHEYFEKVLTRPNHVN